MTVELARRRESTSPVRRRVNMTARDMADQKIGPRVWERIEHDGTTWPGT
jgi:hypothetical protein